MLGGDPLLREVKGFLIDQWLMRIRKKVLLFFGDSFRLFGLIRDLVAFPCVGMTQVFLAVEYVIKRFLRPVTPAIRTWARVAAAPCALVLQFRDGDDFVFFQPVLNFADTVAVNIHSKNLSDYKAVSGSGNR